ncbi:MAG: PQQ-dependent sugar dehydrogenase [Planctomycetota bacterium]
MTQSIFLSVIKMICFTWGAGPAQAHATQNTTGMPLTVLAEFSISIFAQGLGKPRVMAYDPGGNLVVSIPSEGKVVALPDRDGDGVADEVITVTQGLNLPHGLAFRCLSDEERTLTEYNNAKTTCQLYIAETDQVVVYDYDENNLKAVGGRKILDLPDGEGHVTRTIMFMPFPNHNKILASVGSTCNVCFEKDWRRATILVSGADGSNLRVFASGLRNSVFMAVHPVTEEIWATENGRDWLGDNLPPDEINVIEEGKDYGWPICYGGNIRDTDFDKRSYTRNPCREPQTTPSYIDIQAHSAPLGLAFIPKEGWPEEYWYDLLVAYHGSWNRSVPTGYKDRSL